VRVDDPHAPRLIHDEPLFFEGRRVGLTTSAAWGHRLNANLAIASLAHNEGVTKRWLAQPGFTIEIAGERFAVTLQLTPFYDPRGERIKR
jgi:glycine cleavage system aminomethyltransferase T